MERKSKKAKRKPKKKRGCGGSQGLNALGNVTSLKAPTNLEKKMEFTCKVTIHSFGSFRILLSRPLESGPLCTRCFVSSKLKTILVNRSKNF